ncbi:MAG: phosphoglycerate kinase [Deltaproteobacteria bacterium]|jgi:phosphoglycerate kinase|nr:phosphoglycerate kinase [Deltaproteobacteria bacterium]
MSSLDPKLPLIQNRELEGKVVLARVDHNVVEKGVIKDAFRIDSTFGLVHYIASKGGFPILMTHAGRTRDKKTGRIKTGPETSVAPIVGYLDRKLRGGFAVPELPIDPELGIVALDPKALEPLLKKLKAREIGGIYLPNTRWFAGEESKDEKTEALADSLSAIADLYVNDAFGSWQPHASTFDVAAKLPPSAGFLMQKELSHLELVLNPEPPFLAVVAGAKYDTKIGPLLKIYEKTDSLLLGGVIYNAFLSAKYGVKIKGVAEEDVKLAADLVAKDKSAGKILEPGALVESPSLDRRDPAGVRIVKTKDFKEGREYGYFLDVAPESFDCPKISSAISDAKTIFVNAVMGLASLFPEGSARFYSEVGRNKAARKLFGGGDTLQELKELTPGLYMEAMDDESYYFFTGGGAVLTAIESGAYGIKPVKALLDNAN